MFLNEYNLNAIYLLSIYPSGHRWNTAKTNDRHLVAWTRLKKTMVVNESNYSKQQQKNYCKYGLAIIGMCTR